MLNFNFQENILKKINGRSNKILFKHNASISKIAEDNTGPRPQRNITRPKHLKDYV